MKLYIFWEQRESSFVIILIHTRYFVHSYVTNSHVFFSNDLLATNTLSQNIWAFNHIQTCQNKDKDKE